MMNKFRVIQYGLGPIGNKITSFLAERNHKFEIVGAIDLDTKKLNIDIGILAGLPEKIGINVSNDNQKILDKSKAEVVVLTTTSSLTKIKPQVIEIISAGLNIVTTCEELAHSWITDPVISSEIDTLAKENNVTVLATGVNPGFLMDSFPLNVTSVCQDVEKIRVERIQSANFRRRPFQVKIGVGLKKEEFYNKAKNGIIRHVGLKESMYMIAHKFGWVLDKTEETIDPVISSKDTSVQELFIKEGDVLGVNQIGRGYIKDKEVITLVFKASIDEQNPCDRVVITGIPNIDLSIKDGVNGEIATCAIVVNAIPEVIKAPAGLKTMADIGTITWFL